MASASQAYIQFLGRMKSVCQAYAKRVQRVRSVLVTRVDLVIFLYAPGTRRSTRQYVTPALI